jgi:hypothetical protein
MHYYDKYGNIYKLTVPFERNSAKSAQGRWQIIL